MSNIDKNSGIWFIDIAKKRHKCDYNLCLAIKNNFNIKTIVDIGCGIGLYCKILFDYGYYVIGYEGTPKIQNISVYDNIITKDLTKPIFNYEIIPCFDLTLCLEVGEHIPKKYETIFVDNLCKYAKNKLIISWADKEQYSASGHVNPKTKSEVIFIFTERGYCLDYEKTEILRKQSSFSWFKNNLLVLENERLYT